MKKINKDISGKLTFTYNSQDLVFVHHIGLGWQWPTGSAQVLHSVSSNNKRDISTTVYITLTGRAAEGSREGGGGGGGGGHSTR